MKKSDWKILITIAIVNLISSTGEGIILAKEDPWTYWKTKKGKKNFSFQLTLLKTDENKSYSFILFSGYQQNG